MLYIVETTSQQAGKQRCIWWCVWTSHDLWQNLAQSVAGSKLTSAVLSPGRTLKRNLFSV
jgi:hypothetical protein